MRLFVIQAGWVAGAGLQEVKEAPGFRAYRPPTPATHDIRPHVDTDPTRLAWLGQRLMESSELAEFRLPPTHLA